MSLLYTDGFDLQDYGTRYLQSVKSATLSLLTGANTRFTAGSALRIASATSFGTGWAGLQASVTASAQIYIGAACRYSSGPTASGTLGNFFGFLTDGGLTQQLAVGINSANGISAYRTSFSNNSNPSNLIGSSAGGVVPNGAWFYFEVSAVIHPAAGSVTARINGNTVLTLINVNTKNGGTSTNIDAISIGEQTVNSGINCDFDDLYVCNALGTTNNTFLGDCRIQTLLPNGAGSSTQFTPTGSANNYANVNDVPDSTSTYNSSSTTGQRDTYAMGDLAASTTAVLGVQQVTYAFNSDTGTGQLKAAQQSGATVSYGATRSLGTASMAYFDIFQTNPATGVAYTISDVNALEGGAEVA